MALTAYSTPAPLGSDLVYRFVTKIEHILLDLRALPRARATQRVLNSLSNRELADLGLVRADIQYIARNLCHRAL
ncbi:DUF1127 domain-containing protein [Pontivivens nitratireducens]|uniref:DUF1127 domain-containing protein n=1 Tax=Pontivivens nitratireducens TaxID=2758038 RepID=UPI00163AD7CD|nr:DUF1127 domain-containing protein [Pontibrevibacter nitratireducens]